MARLLLIVSAVLGYVIGDRFITASEPEQAQAIEAAKTSLDYLLPLIAAVALPFLFGWFRNTSFYQKKFGLEKTASIKPKS